MDNFLQTIRNLGAARIAAIGGIGLFLIGFLIYFIARFSGGDMQVLYKELELADSKQIVQELEKRDIAYQLKKNGAEIHVPSGKVARMRIEMAELELPSSRSGKGYELFDNVDALGSTNFIQNINQLRAMEGELSRTIRSVQGVKNARVHLVLPKREMFTREQQTPKASVILMLKNGFTLNTKQVSSIQHLVASSVAKLETKNVSIIDNFGNLLTQNFTDDEQMIISTNEERRQNHERRLTASVQSLLEKTIGYGKVRAEVNVEMDFSRVVTNEESFDPDQQVVRSTVTVEEQAKSNENDPNAVTVSENIPNESQGASGSTAESQSSRTEETVNYEISKKITNAVRNSGIIKRISVAVLVDGTYDYSTGDKVYKPRSEKEMELLAALVRSAIGYDANRGDQVEVVNMRFKSMEEAFEDEPPILWGFTKSEVMKMAEGLGVALVAILVILLVIRPLITKAFETSPMPGEGEGQLFGDPSMANTPLLGQGGGVPGIDGDGGIESELDELIDIARVEGRVKASSVRKIGEIIDKHPEEALSIIRTWMYQEE